MKSHLTQNGNWSRRYISDALRRMVEFCAARAVKSEEIELLEQPTVTIIDEKERREAM